MIGLGAVGLLLLIGSVVILCCLSGRRAGLDEAMIWERLRECYV